MNWKSLFFEEEPDSQEEQTDSQVPTVAPTPVTLRYITPSSSVAVEGTDEMVSMCKAIMHDAIVKVGQCPFSEFSEALDSLEVDTGRP